MTGKEYYGTRDLAELSGLTQERVRQLVTVGEIKAHKVGRDWVIPREEAERWLSERGIQQPGAD
jgi:excisionase family DNA binding protein